MTQYQCYLRPRIWVNPRFQDIRMRSTDASEVTLLKRSKKTCDEKVHLLLYSV